MSATRACLITTQTIEELSPALFNFALRTVGRREDAEDLVQETWFSALKTASTFEGRSSLRSWLTSILRRRIADRYRRERRTLCLDEEQHESQGRAPTEQHDWEEAFGFASKALAELAGLERSAITLCDVEDLDRDEVAARLQITRGHLRVLLHRARSKMEYALRRDGIGAELCA